MRYVTVCLLVYIFCTWLPSVTPFIGLESLKIRVSNLEVALNKEQEKSETLQIVVAKLTTEKDESTTRVFTQESDKISETVVQQTAKVIRNELQSIRHGLGVEKARGVQLELSHKECKEHVIKTGKLVRSLENEIQDCKSHATKTEQMMSRLSEDMSELKANWTVMLNHGPERVGGEVVTDTATCSRRLQGVDTGVSGVVQLLCQKNTSFLYVVKVKSIKEESSLRKIYTDLVVSFGKGSDYPYTKTTIVMMESSNCNETSKFTPGYHYLIMANDHLTESTQEGSRYEFLLNGRSFHMLHGQYVGTEHSTTLARFIAEFLRGKKKVLCIL